MIKYILIRFLFLLGFSIIGIYLYYLVGLFKKVGELSSEELNEMEIQDKEISTNEAREVNSIGKIIFIILGCLVWAYFGTTVGKIASELTNHRIFKWICYFLMYFFFLRIPFGVGNRMIKNSLEKKQLPERLIFLLVMISFYILSICCFDLIPSIFKWHLAFLK